MKNRFKFDDKINEKLEQIKLKQAYKKVMTKGNLWAVAVGILVGAAFGTLVNSLANDIIMQSIAKAFHYQGINYMSFGTTKWERLSIMDAAGNQHFVKGLPINGIKYGKFLGALLSFVIVLIFLVLTTWIATFIWSKIKHKKIEKNPNIIKPKTDELILAELQKISQELARSKPKKAISNKSKSAKKKSK